MWSNYLKIALRTLRQHPGYVAINVVGLAAGIAVCLLITLYVRHELSYDDFHANADRVYRIVSDWGDFSVPQTSWPVVKNLEVEYPEIPVARLLQTDAIIEYENTQYHEDRIFFATPTFFEVLSFSLRRGDSEAALRRPFTVVMTPEAARRYFGDDWNGATLSLQPLTSIHLYSHHNSEIEPNGSAATLYVFGIIGAFVLVLACVNFINLATARAAERAKEVGVRKAVGAGQGQLARQFFAESMLMAGVALGFALALATLALPVFQALTGISLAIVGLVDPFPLAALLAITLGAGVLAGSYPAVYLSRFQPSAVLRGRGNTRGGGRRVRQVLVVFQFAISTVLIVGTAVAYLQLDHLRGASLGFDSEQVVAGRAFARNCLPGPLWAGGVRGRAAPKRGRHPQSAGGFGREHPRPADEGRGDARRRRLRPRRVPLVRGRAALAGALRLSRRPRPGPVSGRRRRGAPRGAGGRQHAGAAGGAHGSGARAAAGIAARGSGFWLQGFWVDGRFAFGESSRRSVDFGGRIEYVARGRVDRFPPDKAEVRTGVYVDNTPADGSVAAMQRERKR